MTQPQRNDPYSRPINATRPEHVRVGDYYGRPATDKARTVAAGNPNAQPAFGLHSTAPYEGSPERSNRPRLEPTTLNPDTTSPNEPPTEEDLFG